MVLDIAKRCVSPCLLPKEMVFIFHILNLVSTESTPMQLQSFRGIFANICLDLRNFYFAKKLGSFSPDPVHFIAMFFSLPPFSRAISCFLGSFSAFFPFFIFHEIGQFVRTFGEGDGNNAFVPRFFSFLDHCSKKWNNLIGTRKRRWREKTSERYILRLNCPLLTPMEQEECSSDQSFVSKRKLFFMKVQIIKRSFCLSLWELLRSG